MYVQLLFHRFMYIVVILIDQLFYVHVWIDVMVFVWSGQSSMHVVFSESINTGDYSWSF